MNLDHWEALWRCLILSSILTHYNEHLARFEPESRERIRQAFDLVPQGLKRIPYFKHPYAVASSLATSSVDVAIERHVLSQDWDDIEQALLACPDDRAPAIIIELDSLDDYFDNSPSIMAEIQAGLALYLAKLEHGPFGQRTDVRIHAAVRQTTLPFIRRHKGREMTGDSFIEIRWSKGQIAGLLSSLLRDGEASMEALGPDSVMDVPMRGSEENASEYLLRHTTLTPRTAVQIARALIDDEGDAIIDAKGIRSVVAAQAEIIASSTLHQIASDLRAFGARTPMGTRIITDEGHQEELKARLVNEFERLGKDRFDRRSLQGLVTAWDALTRPYLADTLWVHRMLGLYGLSDFERGVLT